MKNNLFFVFIIVIAFPLASFGTNPQEKNPENTNGGIDNQSKTSTDMSGDARVIYSQVSKSVVIVEVTSPNKNIQGSGVVYSNSLDHKSSWVVTNAHVVKDATTVSVLKATQQYKAVVEYADDDLDLAILHVDGIALPESTPYKGSQMSIGEKVFAIGSPLGLENSITEGILSGKRELNGVILLQNTAPVSKGSSGGGLFDSQGRFIGVTTFKLIEGESINFAVDAAYILEIRYALFYADIIREAFENTFSPDDIAIIKSHKFTKWLLNERSVNGKKLYTEVKQIMDELLIKSETEEVTRNKLQQIVQRFINEQKGDSHYAVIDSEETVQLVCSVSDKYGKPKSDRTILLDYKKKTANGYPATISDAEVMWISKGGFKTLLNRYTGFISIGSPKFPILVSGKCYRTKDKQF